MDESRHYFRIDDRIHLRCQPLSDPDRRKLTEQLASGTDASCSPVAELRALTAQMSSVLAGIRKRDPDLAQYLEAVDRKIDAVARALAQERLGEELVPDTNVNIGGGGMAFSSERPSDVGGHLDMRMVFFPSYLCIRVVAEVVRCDSQPDRPGEYLVGVEFAAIGAGEQEALIRYLTGKQSSLLRQIRHRE